MNSNMKAFASDNYAGVHADIMRALQECNVNHAPAYGNDAYTAQVQKIFKRHFGDNAETFMVYSGTGANVLGLDAITEPYHSILCAQSAHIFVDECGAIGKITGSQLLPIATADGKLTPEAVMPHLRRFGDEHHAQPRVISISQTTEYGTVYSLGEISALSSLAHKHDMLLHMDGARICNAAASLGCDLRTLTTDAGVDVLSFGGTKNGMMFGEGVVFLNSTFAKNAKFYRKQDGQLASKHRFIAAQFIAMLEGDLWLRNARHANAMAKRLADGIAGVKKIFVTQPVQSNVVFAKLPESLIEELQKHFVFYVWNELTGEVRWMTSFDTTEDEVDRFAAKIREL